MTNGHKGTGINRDLTVPTINIKLCVFHLFTFEHKHFLNLSKLFKHKTDFYRNSHVIAIVHVDRTCIKHF